ncbi:HAMP domain-containing protein [Rhodovarius crocodyli]|uniref:histidine kinase n=1 Tax=Rhodovarius crocodyli TaxID=1979269 RepID=A0A437MDU6_9PROT|nr:ATP-binding protein [Rhodovarius crocodyli]RVT95753.1 HAMP domain-containing protein [Rhodovarius crocodyli]
MRRLLQRMWPNGLAGRAMFVLVTGLVVLHVGSVGIHEVSLRSSHQASRDRAMAETLWRSARTLSLTPVEQRDSTAHALSGPALELHWPGIVQALPQRDGDAELEDLRQEMIAAVPELRDVHLAWGDPGRHHLLVGSLRVDDAGAVSFAMPLFRGGHGTPFDPIGFIALVVLAVSVGVASVFVLRNLTRPLADLSAAADRIGRDESAVRLREEGPIEMQRAARAFNAMQERIRRLLEDRTLALAAVSHDLRSPITRMRLLVGFLEDEQARDQLDANLDEMAGMVESVLDYMRDGAIAEAARPTDLAAMLRTLCDGAGDTGADVTFDGPVRLVQVLRPVVMRRVLSNLLGNALTYGGNARVALRALDQRVEIEIADDGPGIPEAELERVLQPFHRLEESRNRSTGGVGLGLTIAARFVAAEGGVLALSNRSEGGLRVLVTLPLRPPAPVAERP